MPSVLEQILPATAETLRPRNPLDLIPWIAQTGMPVDGRPFDLDTVPYMRGIFEDDHPEKVAEKGSQIGGSVLGAATVLHGADQRGERWMYFLPTDEESDMFVADRLNSIIKGSPYIESRIGDLDSRGLKRVGAGIVYIRGLWTKRRAKSVPTDGIVFDEVDEHKPEMLALAQDRNLMSLNPKTYYLSVPSFTKYGIDAKFLESDQRYYLVKCSACGEWANVDKDFPANFLPVPKERAKSWPDGTTHYRGCRWCGNPLDMRTGEWVPLYPGRRVHGYHISQLLRVLKHPAYPNVASYLMDQCEKHKGDQIKLQRWHVAYLGRPFDGEGARINEAVLESLQRDYAFRLGGNATVMGVDQGNALHVSIYVPSFGGLHLVYCERCLAWGRVYELFDRFRPFVAGCDRGPGIHEARKFAAKYPGRVFLIAHAESDEYEGEGNDRKRKIKEDLLDGHIPVPWVTVSRTLTLDATVDFVEGGKLALPNPKKLEGEHLIHFEEYCDHLIALKWKYEETPSGQRKRVYLRNENHHGTGLNYARIAFYELDVEPPAPDVGVIGMWAPGRTGHA